ncbi:MAG: hypothetical protein CL624_07385 [Arcobacter sp.]|nr:hypothetical protein [Arcobacter sp.]|tara:strand:+ start:16095 stop:17996 length:1902 start_codon:yes stop_codon:yes gene_type:complete
MIKLILFFILTINIYANNILEIEEGVYVQDTKSFIYYIEDTDKKLNNEKILVSKDLIIAKKTQLPASKGPFWTKLQIKNTTNKVQNLVIYNSLAGTNEIDVYLYKDLKLIKKHFLGDLREQEKRELISRYSMFQLSLDTNEEVTIVSRIKSYYLHNIDWVIKKHNTFIEEEVNKMFVFGILFGISALFLIYNILSFKTFKETPFLIIAIHTILSTAYLYGFNGIFYQINVGLNLDLITAVTWNISNIGAIMLILFPYYFFNIKKDYPRLNYYLKFKILVFIFATSTILYAQFFNEDFFIATTILIITILNAFSLLVIAFYMYMKKEFGSNYYLFGQGILLVTMIIHVLNIMNIIPYNETNKYIYPIGIVFDLIALTIAQHIKIKNKVRILEENRELLLEQSLFASIGQAIGHITHQWKHPLTNLGSTITLLEAMSLHKPEGLTESFKNKIPSINNDIEYMNNILIEFSSLYTSKKKESYFCPITSIENIKRIITSKLILKNITIETTLNNVKRINSFEHIFSNILLILIDNSIDAFKSKSNNRISISLEKSKTCYLLTFKDNAGGIKVKPIDKIFDYNISTKVNTDNKGMGIPIMKMLVEDKLKGSIQVKNDYEGASFLITIPYKDTKKLESH